jgi:Bax protein
VQPPDTRALLATFDNRDFQLADVRQGARVPRVFVSAIPQDIGAIQSVEGKRNAFIRAMLPLILADNERIAAERLYIRELRLRQALERRLAPVDQAWLAAMAQRYKTKEGDWDALLERVDEIPVSLALGQTILESGWGSSVVARKLNSLFGMIGGDGTDPARHATFSSLQESVSAYVHNLNVHFAYAAFRKVRAQMRLENKPLDGHTLAATLLAYSELGAEYTRNLQALITSENLSVFESARLAEGD